MASCGPPPLDATFTSRVVQHDTCKTVGARPQVCTKEEANTDVRVHLVEREDDNVWLYGVPRGGVSDRAVLGSRDAPHGFLVVDTTTTSNAGSGCVVVSRLEIALAVSADVDPKKVGVDPCVPLVGRENETTTSSPGCDAVNQPPQQTVLVANRRWEKPPTCTP